MLTPSLFFVIVISLINGFQVFDQVWVMTEGGPAGSSTVVVEQIVKNTFSYGRAGYASAMSVVTRSSGRSASTRRTASRT